MQKAYSLLFTCIKAGIATAGSRAMSSALEQAKDELICAICTEFLDRPRSLVCLHSFCEQCLKHMHRVSNVTANLGFLTCPECRAKTDLPSEGVQGIFFFKLLRFVLILSVILAYNLSQLSLGNSLVGIRLGHDLVGD